jgi:NAD-dependent dihydropyrimidine dehydrogenase PreA subunit
MDKEVGKCLYNYDTKLPPCVILRVFKYSYLHDFINDHKTKTSDYAIALKIDCIEFTGDHINIKNDNCINCMFCVFGCPGNNIAITTNFSLKAMCSNFNDDYDQKLKNNIIDSLFQGSFIELPNVKLSQFKIRFNSFSDFTSKEETTNMPKIYERTKKELKRLAR